MSRRPTRSRPTPPRPPLPPRPRSTPVVPTPVELPVVPVEAEEIDALREEIAGRLARQEPARWNADPEEAQRSLARLVLTLVEFLRQLMERQAIRRMEEETLTPEQVEAVGLALMRLEETLHELAERFGLAPEELNLDLGPLGRLL